MQFRYLALVLTLAIGILVGWLLSSNNHQGPQQDGSEGQTSLPDSDAASYHPAYPDELSRLRQRLLRTEQQHQQLMARLDALQERLELFEVTAGSVEEGSGELSPAPPESSPADAGSAIKTNLETLIEAGIDPDKAAWIQQRLDASELERVYLRDRAQREGWINTQRYQQELRKYQNIVQELRDDIGDSIYDLLLYALGRANRIVVQDTMQNSAAAQYGIQAGDHIIEYSGQRVFSRNDLVSLVSKGQSGVMTLVRVQRPDGIHEIYLPRGPLGIRMSDARVRP